MEEDDCQESGPALSREGRPGNEADFAGTGLVTRRRFIAGAGVAAAGAMGAAAAFPNVLRAAPVPAKWDRATDVVIVGTGYAGLAAAIEAHQAGAGVVIIEKSRIMGGNSVIASGGYNAVDPVLQKRQQIEDSIDLHYRQTIEGGDFRGEPEKVHYLVEHALEGLQWLEKLGVSFEPKVYAIVGSLWPRSHDPIGKGRGGAIVRTLGEEVARRKIPVLLECELTGIVRQSPLGNDVLGIEANYRRKKICIKAKKAVVLATGGFGADVAMRSKYDPRLTAEVPTTNVPTATGEAIVYAEDVGADVIGMDFIQLLVACNFYTRQYGSLTNLGIDSAVFVNTKGTRFVAEDARRDTLAEGVLKQPQKVLLWVADDTCQKRFNPQITESIIREGTAFRADTLEELARILNAKFKIPEKTFLETVARYNRMAAAGKDDEFGKKATNLKPIARPPFWASPTQAGVHHTMGGIRTKGTTGRVLDRHGNMIPRLYAAGEVAGGVHGANRLGGNATASCIVFGRIAGRNSAGEKTMA